ncbi:MAG: hypothetical protein JWQ79_822 [Mucilaginibacter sp.]|jgi:hypothetical protein|nr:hypothetical protein [Mucilaginibacter sp.]
MDSPDKETKNPIPLFTPRKNCTGWDLNPDSRFYYVVLAIILAIPFAVIGLYMLFR